MKWHTPYKLPQLDTGHEILSVNVLAKLNDGRLMEAYVSHKTYRWYDRHDVMICGRVVAWRPLEAAMHKEKSPYLLAQTEAKA